jgi:hypothetical protein
MNRPIKAVSAKSGDYPQTEKPSYGVFISANGEKYIGEFLDDSFHGRGIVYDQYGNVVLKGYWQNGEFMGKF